MNEAVNTADARRRALARIERHERNYRLAFFGAVLLEALFLAAFLLLADFRDRAHLLLLISTVAVYTIVALGLLALGAHVNRNTLRVLKAVEALRKP
jgi:hypothetical protein